MLELLCDGPENEAAVADRIPCLSSQPTEPGRAKASLPWLRHSAFQPTSQDSAHLALTVFSRRCAELWKKHHGRRFAVYKNKRSDAGVERGKKAGTVAAAIRGQKAALSALVVAAKTAPDAANHATIIPGAELNKITKHRSLAWRG